MLQFSGRRWAQLLMGLMLCGIGIGLMVQSDLGLSPWEVLHQGISRQTGIKIGTVSILLGIPIMIGWLPLGERPGIGTLINILSIGVVTNLTLSFVPPLTELAEQIAALVIGIVLIGIGSGLYLGARMGAGPRDGLMMGLARRTGIRVARVRTALELSVLVVGWLMGGTIGIGTIAFALGIGPIIQAVLRAVDTPAAANERPSPAPIAPASSQIKG